MLNMVELDRINIFPPAIPCVMGTMYVQVKSMIFFTSTRWGRHCWSAQTCHWKRSCFDSDSNMSLNVSYAVVLAMFFWCCCYCADLQSVFDMLYAYISETFKWLMYIKKR